MKRRVPPPVPEDLQLWDAVKASIKPLAKTLNKKLTKARKLKVAKTTLKTAALMPTDVQITLQPSVQTIRTSTAQRVIPPLSTFERRTAQKLGRGKMEPDATIDLHGHGLEESYIRLLRFIEGQRRQGSRLLLVITGKGASPFGRHTLHGHSHYVSPEREGRIRREVPVWLEETRFRQHVVGFQPAHPRHGGGGAFYVRLRKA